MSLTGYEAQVEGSARSPQARAAGAPWCGALSSIQMPHLGPSSIGSGANLEVLEGPKLRVWDEGSGGPNFGPPTGAGTWLQRFYAALVRRTLGFFCCFATVPNFVGRTPQVHVGVGL